MKRAKTSRKVNLYAHRRAVAVGQIAGVGWGGVERRISLPISFERHSTQGLTKYSHQRLKKG